MTLPYPARSRVVDSITFNPLFAPGERPVFMNYTLLGGQQLIQGSVLGRITASGLLVLSDPAAGDGSEVPMAILCEDVSTYAADGVTPYDTPVSVAVHGAFNPTALTFGPTVLLPARIATVCEQLRAVGIHTRAPGYSG